MKKATPVRNSHTSTADLLTWSEVPPRSSANASRSRRPSDGMSKVLFGGQISDHEAESLNKRKPCSGYKLKEMSGSNIFSAVGETVASESEPVNANVNNRTSVRIVQQGANGKSQISFSTEENISPETPNTLTEVPKQLEVSGIQEGESDSKVKKQLSDAKSKELSGNDIFGPPLEVPPRSLAAARTLEPKQSEDIDEPAPRSVRTSVKVSNPAGGRSNILFGSDEPVVKPVKKIHNQKFAELTGNNIFKGDNSPPGSSEKPLSSAKLREMSGSNIFAEGKVESRVCYGGVRKPPGGDSSIRLF
ncbi:PREDICTED: uncharacterized protein LOC109220362 [Nicotiana attenuata]|uniref:DUF4057 domain-containing protein n=1 Tax=Nicotiana attenuata TaxID=49451 RepID=A0A1J6KM70_NICAT|nr:PREDICTED: uncharacterized protein LOC109220362 [Nicotiana attenuata]OIT20305.1 hypothetical protein A4A49_38513 [Nicotiana attenuata]